MVKVIFVPVLRLIGQKIRGGPTSAAVLARQKKGVTEDRRPAKIDLCEMIDRKTLNETPME